MGDACDLRAAVAGAQQRPLEADGTGDPCDCAPLAPGQAPPGPAFSLRVAPGGRASRQVPPAATGSDLLSGSLAELRADRAVLRATCLQHEEPALERADPRAAPGDAFRSWWYLARAVNGCGASGLSAGSLGSRASPSCP